MQFLFVLLLLLASPPTYANPSDGVQPTAATMVKGDILYLEGEYLIVKEVSGQESRVHVNGQTKIENVAGRLKSGDKITAMVTTDGHALSVTLQIPGGGSPVATPSP
jgi:hypothetical protein